MKVLPYLFLVYLFLFSLIGAMEEQKPKKIKKPKETSTTTQASNQVISVQPIKPSDDKEPKETSSTTQAPNQVIPVQPIEPSDDSGDVPSIIDKPGPEKPSDELENVWERRRLLAVASSSSSSSTQSSSSSGSSSSSNNGQSSSSSGSSSSSNSGQSSSSSASPSSGTPIINRKPDRAYWRPFFFVVPGDAFPAGYDENFNVIYIIRVTGLKSDMFLQIVTKWTIMFGGSVPLVEVTNPAWFEILCAMKVNGEYNLVWTRPKDNITADNPDFIYAKSPDFYSGRQQQGWWIARYGICNSVYIAYNSNYYAAQYKTLNCFNIERLYVYLYAPNLEVLRYGAWNNDSSRYHQRTYKTALFDFHEFDVRENSINMSHITTPDPTRSTTTTTTTPIAITTPEQPITNESPSSKSTKDINPEDSLPKICYASADESFCLGD